MVLGVCLDNRSTNWILYTGFFSPCFPVLRPMCVSIVVNEINSEGCLDAGSDKRLFFSHPNYKCCLCFCSSFL